MLALPRSAKKGAQPVRLFDLHVTPFDTKGGCRLPTPAFMGLPPQTPL